MNKATITGHSAEVRYGYHVAAALMSWSLRVDSPDRGTLTATVVNADAFRVSQQPLTFVVPRPRGQPWRWPILSLQIEHQALTASVGAQEDTHG